MALALFRGFAEVVIALGREREDTATSVWLIPGPDREIDPDAAAVRDG